MCRVREGDEGQSSRPLLRCASSQDSSRNDDDDDEGTGDGRLGGGVAIGVEKSLVLRDLSDLIPTTLADLEVLLVKVVHEHFELLVCGVYASHFGRKRRLFAPLERWLLDLCVRRPLATLLVCGDFNSSRQPLPHLFDLSRDIAGNVTFARSRGPGVVSSRTDWVMSSRRLQHRTRTFWSGASDHCAIVSRVSLPLTSPARLHRTYPVPAAALQICQDAELGSRGLEEFVACLQRAIKAQRHVR